MGVYVNSPVPENNANDIAVAGFNSAQSRADNMVDEALSAVNSLAYNFSTFTPNLDINLDDVDTSPYEIQFPTAPEVPELNLVLPEMPSDIAINPVAAIQVSDAPEFTTPAPTLNFPVAPTLINPTDPGSAPVIDLALDFPTAPTVALPSVPTLRELDLPATPSLTLPEFEQDPPNIDITSPANVFSFSEDPYSSDKLTLVCDTLVSQIQSGKGAILTPEVENMIWDRARNREQIGADKERNEILADNASTGFSRPTGSTLQALLESDRAFQERLAEINRELAIKQSELAVEGLKFSIQSAIALEQTLISEYSKVQERALSAAKFAQEMVISIFNSEVQVFNLRLDSYKSFVIAFEAKLKLEIEKVNIYRAQLEAQSLINQLNESDIRIYSATIDGLKSAVDIYRTQVQAIESRVGVERAKIDAYRGQVDAFTAKIAGETAKVQQYSEVVRAEATKSSAFESQVKAFTARLQAYGAEVDSKKLVADTAVKIESLKLQQQSLKLDTFSKSVEAKVQAFTAQTRQFQSKASMYTAEVGAESARIDVSMKQIDQQIDYSEKRAMINLKKAEIFIANVGREADLAAERLKASAQISAQLAASSLAGINYSASVSHSESLGNSLSESHSFDG